MSETLSNFRDEADFKHHEFSAIPGSNKGSYSSTYEHVKLFFCLYNCIFLKEFTLVLLSLRPHLGRNHKLYSYSQGEPSDSELQILSLNYLSKHRLNNE